MKIAIGQMSHETNTFSKVPTTEELFRKWEWEEGEKIIEIHKDVKDYLGGMIERANQLNIEILPTFSAAALPSGVITKETYETIKYYFKQQLDLLSDVDAICLALHGAGVVEGIEDLEGDFLQFIRECAGNDIPIIATLDLHGNITEKMVEYADVLLGDNFYPHIDSYERGIEAINFAYRILNEEIKPTMFLHRLPIMIPTSTSNHSPVKDINQLCWEIEKQPSVLDCTFFHGFPYTDIQYVGASVLCITDRNIELAQTLSMSVATAILEKKDQFYPHMPSPKEGIAKARDMIKFPVVINETSDNPGAGTPCDGTRLLKEMLEAKLDKACIGMIYDPEVVQLAHRLGPGSTIEVFIGGKTDCLHGDPVFIKGYVKTLTDGIYIQSSPMWKGRVVNLGKTARLQVDGLDIVIGSKRSQVFDEQIFLLHGIDVNKYKIIGLKSSQHFRAAYELIASKIITVDSPGLSTLNLGTFEYQNVSRPIFPLDEIS